MRGDAPHYLAVSHSLIHDFDLDLRNQYDPDGEPFFYTGDLASTARAGRDGRLYPRPNVGLPVALLPAYVAAETIAAVLPESFLNIVSWDRSIAVRDLLSFGMAILYAWTAVMTLRIAKKIRPDGKAATVATIVAFATPPLLAISILVFPEIPVAFLGIWFLSKQLRGDSPGYLRTIPLALLPWFDVRYVAISLVGLAWIMWEARRQSRDFRSLAAIVTLPLASAAAYLVLSAWMFGPSLGFGSGREIALVAAVAMRGAVGLLLDADFGLLVIAPFWLVAIAGAPEVRNEFPGYATFASLAFLATWGLAAFSEEWWGGYSPPARFLVPVLPLLVPMLTAGFARLAVGSGRWLVYAGIGWAVMMSWVLVRAPINLWTAPSMSRGLVAASFIGAWRSEQLPTSDVDIAAFREHIRAGDLESVAAALDRGIDPARGLSVAVRRNQPAILSLLVDRGASGTEAARACGRGRGKVERASGSSKRPVSLSTLPRTEVRRRSCWRRGEATAMRWSDCLTAVPHRTPLRTPAKRG